MKLNPRLGGTRIGVIVPSVNCITEPELYATAPPGYSFHAVRVPLLGSTPENLAAMNAKVEEAASLLATLKPRAVVYACTAGSFIGGAGSDEAIGDRIAAIAGCPAVTTSTAMLAAFRHLSVRRIALGTPYLDPITRAEVDFLEACGIEVVRWAGLRLSGPAIGQTPPERFAQLARDLDAPEVQAIFISCTSSRTLEITAEVEAELGKPLLSSNQVSLWAVLRLAGFDGRIEGYGRLLAGQNPGQGVGPVDAAVTNLAKIIGY